MVKKQNSGKTLEVINQPDCFLPTLPHSLTPQLTQQYGCSTERDTTPQADSGCRYVNGPWLLVIKLWMFF